jgi:chromosome partitioning protein
MIALDFIMAVGDTDMLVAVFASGKGGVGKSTLCLHLAVEAGLAGAGPVGLVDLDTSSWLAHWWDMRTHAEEPWLELPEPDLAAALDRLRARGCKLALIDTPGDVNADVARAIGLADLTILPTQYYAPDIWGIGPTVTMAERARKPMCFVLTRAKHGVSLADQAVKNLSRHAPVAPQVIFDRTDYGAAQSDGRTAQEVAPRSAAAEEIRALWDFIAHRLELASHEPVSIPRRPAPTTEGKRSKEGASARTRPAVGSAPAGAPAEPSRRGTVSATRIGRRPRTTGA